MRQAIITATFLSSGLTSALEVPASITADRLLQICESSTVAAASGLGGKLGWKRLPTSETEEWRTSFVANNGGAVDVVSWERKQATGKESLSFWVSTGPNAHTACAYMTMNPDGLLDSSSKRLGTPDSLEANDAIEMISAWWNQGNREYSFTQVGSSVIVNVGTMP